MTDQNQSSEKSAFSGEEEMTDRQIMPDDSQNSSESAMTLEESLASLDQVLVQLDSGDLSLEEAFDAYAKGMKLVRLCSDKIDRVEKKCLVISENGDDHEL